MIRNKIPVNLNGRVVYFEEFSFYEYKNICKMFISNNISDVSRCLDIILDRIEVDYPLNIIEKFECLVSIRNSILGNELSMKKDDVQINYDLNQLLTNVFIDREFTLNDCVFKTPRYFTHSSVQNAAADYLYSYKGKIIFNEDIDEKVKVLNALDLPIMKIVSEIEKIREDSYIEILDNQVRLNIYDEAIVLFIRAIFNHDLMDLYKFEYQLLRHLELRGEDLQHYTYPELKININFLTKEKEEEKEIGSNS